MALLTELERLFSLAQGLRDAEVEHRTVETHPDVIAASDALGDWLQVEWEAEAKRCVKCDAVIQEPVLAWGTDELCPGCGDLG